MNDRPDVDSLVSSLRTDSDSARKFAVFKLQALLGDRDFALEFVQSDGPFALRCAVVETSGNTLAYALGSLNKLLELGLGWECVDEGVVEKVSERWKRKAQGEVKEARDWTIGANN